MGFPVLSMQGVSYILVLALASLSMVKAMVDYSGYQVLRVQVNNQQEAETLKNLEEENLFDFWTEIRLGKHVDIMASPNTIDKLGHSMDWTSYHPLDEMYGWFDYLETTYDFIETESIGKSYEGQEMIVLKVCRGGCGNKPAMWIDSGIHARE